MSISISLNLAGFPLGSALAGMVITSSLFTTFVLAGIASVVTAVATISIPSDTKVLPDYALFSEKPTRCTLIAFRHNL